MLEVISQDPDSVAWPGSSDRTWASDAPITNWSAGVLASATPPVGSSATTATRSLLPHHPIIWSSLILYDVCCMMTYIDTLDSARVKCVTGVKGWAKGSAPDRSGGAVPNRIGVETAMPRRRKKLAVAIVEALRDRIANGALPVGARLPTEQRLIDEFNVSRTVVREAIAEL